MNTEEYKTITRYVYDVCGITLGEDKQYLISQRLTSVAEEFGCKALSSFAALLQVRRNDSSLREKVVVAITTNETSFFRDSQPFKDFSKVVLPQLTTLAAERKKRIPVRRGSKISIWSAASSTGQEAYTLAMQINDYLGAGRAGVLPEDFLITGTDISSDVLAKAMAGEFSEIEVGRGLEVAQLQRHFEQIGKNWVVKPHLRDLVEFRQLNLMQKFTHLGSFDVVFCRNVLIYFDLETKRKILSQIYNMLAPDGILVLGVSENTYTISDKFESFNCGKSVFYKKT